MEPSNTVFEHSTQTPGTNTENQKNSIPSKPPNHLDIALQAFICEFTPSEHTGVSVEHILRGISHNVESLCKPQLQAKQQRKTLHHPTCDVASMTVVHKLDARKISE